MLASSALIDVGGLGADDADHRAVRALHLEHLVGEHAVVVVADAGEPHEAFVLDVLDEEADLVHVRAQHQHGRALGSPLREVVVAERVARLLVRERRELGVHELGDLLLVAGDAPGGIELEHEVEHPIGHRWGLLRLCGRADSGTIAASVPTEEPVPHTTAEKLAYAERLRELALARR